MRQSLSYRRGAAGLEPVRDAITRYIRGQATQVEIVSRPPQPVALGTLATIANPAQAQQMLGITATAR